MSETACVVRSYCPGCEPDADPIGEALTVGWCESHAPARDGLDDPVVSAGSHLPGTTDVGGEDNRRWCELLHRDGRRSLRRRASAKRRRALTPPAAG